MMNKQNYRSCIVYPMYTRYEVKGWRKYGMPIPDLAVDPRYYKNGTPLGLECEQRMYELQRGAILRGDPTTRMQPVGEFWGEIDDRDPMPELN